MLIVFLISGFILTANKIRTNLFPYPFPGGTEEAQEEVVGI